MSATLNAVLSEGSILENRPLSADTFLLRLRCPEVAAPAEPGQFVKLRAWAPPESGFGPLLDRPFSIHDAEGEILSLLYRVVGPATKLISQAGPGDRLKVTGPLGRSLPADFGAERGAYLVAGGIGLAPMALAARRLAARSRPIHLFYGERLQPLQVEEAWLKGWAGDFTAACEDGGGYGSRGLVTGPLEEALKARPRPLFACGPVPMLAAVSRLAEKYRVPLLASAEAGMACGLGVCLTCSLPLKAGGRLRVCREGPVVDGLAIDWEEKASRPVNSKPASAPPERTPVKKTDLSVNLGPLKLKNPLMNASGTFGYGLELKEFCPPEKLGAVIAKGISLEPWPGNPGPRLAETAGGMLNAIGLENIGLEAFVARALPPLKASGATVAANILGHSADEYGRLAAGLAGTEVDFIEINVSCPNVSCGGLAFGADPVAVHEVALAVRENCGGKPFMVKLTPLASDVAAVARAAERAGAAAVSLINTIPAMAVDLQRRRPKLANVVGGLSGPAVKAVALRQVWQCVQAVDIPVVGGGGIFTAIDALEFILVGATAVEVGTAILVDPAAPLKIIEGIEEWMLKEGLNDLSQLRGSLQI